MLNTRFFDQIDILIKEFLTSVILEKQRSQMNQSVCYNVFRITEWQHLLVKIDNKEIDVEIRKQEQDIQQILFSSLVRTIFQEAILEYVTFHITELGSSMEFKKTQNKSQKTEIHYLACNLTVIKHKGQPLKRFKAGIEKDARKEKQVLKNSTNVNNNNTESVTTNINGRKCGNCKQYGHYTKTCPNIGIKSIIIVVDKTLRNVDFRLDFGETQIAAEMISCGDENIQNADQVLFGACFIFTYTTFYKTEIPVKYWKKLVNGLPKVNSVEIER
ncbi:hypothetical protein Glove_9g246 [Diversispora epigaea]|uniref:CCHC-type domain-containing protein n=1 Tax=Diversispora epigaea TaxID=1348612 RepID=A0A397JQ88_9GLOM|nr:hypothetical protein Glove_9g246 [Diversispora epigaea]